MLSLLTRSTIRPQGLSTLKATSVKMSTISSLKNAPAGDPHEFTVTYDNGFLPLHEPMAKLPAPFEPLNDILEKMPVEVPGGHGLLYHGKLADYVQANLPKFDLSHIEKANNRLLAALYRDLTFLTSAYLLEPCDINHRKTGNYGLGRDRLPANIAMPLAHVAKRLNAKPFMEYALSYALYNWQRIDKSRGLDYDNLKLIRRLHGGPAESGFILVHVAMVAHTGTQVKNTDLVIKAAEAKNREQLNAALDSYLANLQTINTIMETMWARSAPQDYMKLRTFIMGTKDQPMFPKGVIYEGVSTEPQVYRGESGANDSIIPTCDSLFGLHFPNNPMTGILLDFRQYRPRTHEAYIQDVKERSEAAKVRDFCMADPETAVKYLANLDMVREFRMRHWNFTKQYIIQFSDHPVATGGSPITTWLPNQLSGVLSWMETIIKGVEPNASKLSPAAKTTLDNIKVKSGAQLRILNKEVNDLRTKFGQ